MKITMLPIANTAQFAATTLLFVLLGAASVGAQGSNNTNTGINAGIFVGVSNTISGGQRSFIGGGLQNTITGGSNSFIGAGFSNFIDGLGNLNNISVIVAGHNNTNRGGRSVIVGGRFNLINTNSRASTITGGEYNQIEAISASAGNILAATIGGGISNLVGSNAVGAVVGGGRFNTNNAADGTVSGGTGNLVNGPGATVPGGTENWAYGSNSFAAGYGANASHAGTFIWSDMSSNLEFPSTDTNQFLIRATGGVGINVNNPAGRALFVSGDIEASGQIIGTINSSNATFSTLTLAGPIVSSNSAIQLRPGGSVGYTVTAQSNESTYGILARNIIAGYASNEVSAGVSGATIAGGGGLDGGTSYPNTVSGSFGTVAGGLGNQAGLLAVVGGGERNTASALNSSILGGFINAASNNGSTVVGGQYNTALADYAAIVGGNDNTNSGRAGFIGGGQSNTITSTGTNAVIGGGVSNVASGLRATVPGGSGGKATNDGAFVWSGVTNVETVSTNTNSFTVRAPGGVRFITTTATNNLAPTNGFSNGVILVSGGTAWQSLSDSNAKTGIRPIDPRAVLAKVGGLPVTEWEYKHDPDRRYFGPMSQDFHAAFGLGRDDTTINTLDADGVLFLSVKGLVQEIKLRDEKIAKLEAWSREQGARSQTEIEELKAKLQAVEERLDSLPPSP